MDIKMLVCTHKPYKFPIDDVYVPFQLGRDETDLDLNILADNTGDNISYKHRYYSEFSAIYWAWKNMDFDCLGICHYRRFFVGKKNTFETDPFYKKILSKADIEKKVKDGYIIVSKRRKYYIETIESHYNHSHNPKDLQIAKKMIEEMFPQYYESFCKVLGRRSAHMFNAFIMNREHLNSYCVFVFPILFELEKRIDFSQYDEYEGRVCGYIGEFLLDTWILEKDVKYREVKFTVLEKQNFLRKAFIFLKRKIFKKERVFR